MEAVVIAGTHSGVGKTTIATGLMAALAKRGRSVQGFKVGPDYIDPSYHTLATGRPSRNLDTWLCSASAVKRAFARAAAEVNVVEGVMGLFDEGPGGHGSTAEVARLLGLPVVLVVDARGMAQSAGAVVHGFASYDPRLRIAGVILNRISSERHYDLLTKAICLPVLGWVAREEAISLPERHLGLVTAAETRPDVTRIGEAVSRHIEIERLLRLSRVRAPKRPVERSRGARVTIAYALDEAFTFYYADNLDLLRAAGAELVPFRPLDDATLPDADLLYFGGGFPEVFQEKLLANASMVEAVRRWERPIYAECGGLMYLSMIGAIPGSVRVTDRLQDFGYARATALVDTPLLHAGETVKGHEFHYSTWGGPANAYRVEKRGRSRIEGYAQGNLLATYIHVHFASRPGLAKRLVDAAERRVLCNES